MLRRKLQILSVPMLVFALAAGALADKISWDGEGDTANWSNADNWRNVDTGVNNVLPAEGDIVQTGRSDGSPARTILLTVDTPDLFKAEVGHFGATAHIQIDGGSLTTTSSTTMRNGSSVELLNGGVWEFDGTNGGAARSTVIVRDTSRVSITRKSSGVNWDWEIHGSQATFEHTGTGSTNYFDLSSGNEGTTINWIADESGISPVTCGYYQKADDLHAVVDLNAMSLLGGEVLTLINASDDLNDNQTTGGGGGEPLDGDETFDSVTVMYGGATLVEGVDYSVVYDEVNDDVQLSMVIPEPATMALLGIGGLVALRRRRR